MLKHTLSTYKWIGLDIDHTLMIFKGFAKVLVEQKGYPEDILSIPLDYSFLYIDILLSNRVKHTVVHLPFGNMLQLSSDGHILKAFHGTKPLSQDEINDIYNKDNKILTEIYKNIEKGISKYNDLYWFLATDFDIPHSYLAAILIDKEDEKDTKNHNYLKIFNDIVYAVEYNYNPKDVKERKGYYFKNIEDEAEKYVLKRTELKSKIQTMRKNGQKFFLLSNSSFEYSDILLNQAIGKDWKECFDLFLFHSCKPGFYTKNTPFVRLDKNTGDIVDSEVKELKEGELYSEGNLKQLEELLQSKPLYIGDHLLSDIMTPNILCNWDTLLILTQNTTGEEYKTIGTKWNELINKDKCDTISTKIYMKYSIGYLHDLDEIY